jgi:ABC-type multidrug transport system fused ATPase/permease subunit
MQLIRGVRRLVGPGTWRRILASTGCSMALAMLDLVAVLLVFPLITLLAEPGSGHATAAPIGPGFGDVFHDATVLAVAVIGLFALKNLLAIVFLRWNLRFILAAETECATRLFRSQLEVASVSPGAVDKASLQRTLTESLRKVFTEGLAFVLPAIADQLVIVLLSVLVLVVAPVEAVMAVATFGVAALGYRRFVHRRTNGASTALHQDHRLALTLADDAVRASREIALQRAQSHFVRRYDVLRHRVSDAQRTISMNEQLPRSFLELCLLLCTATVAVVAFLHHDDTTALALVAMFAAVGFRVLPSLNRVLLAASRNRAALPSLTQLEQDLAAGRALASDPVPTVDPGPVHRVDVRGVTAYARGRIAPLLDDVHLTLERGQMVGLVGPSGAGKTSLVNAILGFVPVSSGEVVANGTTPIGSPEAWYGRAAVVPQEVVIIDASLRENVAFGVDPAAIDDERVLTAVEQAHLGALLDELPDGLATPLGETGARISGGQRQRLGVARALYHDTDVLILDESTAGLDGETEELLLTTLDELKRDRIVLVVSHHRQVMERCDRLVVIESGRIAGERTYA